MIDNKEMRIKMLVHYFAEHQRRYLREEKSCWGFGEHRMAEYILSPFRSLKP